MWALIPVIIALLNTAASRTDPIDHSEMLFPPGDLSQSRDFSDLKKLTEHLKHMEIDNSNDQRQEWNKNNDKYDINSRKIISIDTMDDNIFDDIDDSQIDEPNEIELDQLTTFLTTLLKQPVWMTPVAIVEEPIDDIEDEIDELDDRRVSKRSRYYRRYPWKRQNRYWNNSDMLDFWYHQCIIRHLSTYAYRLKNTLDYESTYFCTPTRQDVYQLLRAIHDVRQGNKSRTVQFCNRKRPVSTVFTNIRFLGRRK